MLKRRILICTAYKRPYAATVTTFNKLPATYVAGYSSLVSGLGLVFPLSSYLSINFHCFNVWQRNGVAIHPHF